MLQPWMIPADLAAGDIKSLDRDWAGVDLHAVESAEDPAFDTAFGALWSEFGSKGEVEQAAVLSKRLQWNGDTIINGCALRYRLLVVSQAGRFAAVRDHTAILPEGTSHVIVHLSHLLLGADWRRTGLAGWLRALPVQTARRVLDFHGLPPDSPITLVAEMEYLDPTDPASLTRLRAYERAGFQKVDPLLVPYVQPDFRSPGEIDMTDRPKALPLTLVIRRVGREQESTISGKDVRRLVNALYGMYGATFRESEMRQVWNSLSNYPAPEERIALIPPTR